MKGAPSPVILSVVGHTNTGKTSLLRTLARDAGFGEVSNRPATTRDVRATDLLVDDRPALRLFDTPGLEDAIGLTEFMAQQDDSYPDPVARIEAFIGGDHDQGRYEQEAKVLRQMLASDAALYVIDAREPVLAKHRDELRLLADCGRPVMPVLNFIADARAKVDIWREQLARAGQHVLAEFDTVVLDHQAERRLFEKLSVLLDSRRQTLIALLQDREQRRSALVDAATRAVAALLIDAAGLRRYLDPDEDPEPARAQLRATLRAAEQHCVDTLLGLFRFDLQTYQPPELPLDQGRWSLDLFDPETVRLMGLRTGSSAAAGGMAGLTVDAFTGGMSLGAAAALGAGLGAAWGAYEDMGRHWIDRLRGRQTLAVEADTLAVMTTRQTQLLAALLRRGHASQGPLQAADTKSGWPSEVLRRRVLRCRSHPDWSGLNPEAGSPRPDHVVAELAAAVRAAAEAVPKAGTTEASPSAQGRD